MSDDVVSGGHPCPKDGLCAVPEGVSERARAACRAVVDDREQRRALSVDAVPPELGLEVVVEVSGIGEGQVHVAGSDRALSLGTHDRARPGSASAGIVIDTAVERVGQLIDVQENDTGDRIDPNEAAQILAFGLDEPGEPRRAGLALDEVKRQHLERRRAHRLIRDVEMLANDSLRRGCCLHSRDVGGVAEAGRRCDRARADRRHSRAAQTDRHVRPRYDVPAAKLRRIHAVEP